MKKIRTVLTSVFMIMLVLSAALFTGCAEEGGTTSGTPFSQTLAPESGVRIWYECQNKVETKSSGDMYSLEEIMGEEDSESASTPKYGRETRVVWIKVYKDGKLTSYSCIKNVYLGYFAKMTDEEILAALESDTDQFLKGQDAQPYEIYLYSDATGHEIVYEGVPSVIQTSLKKDPMYFMTLISKEAVPAFQVYDSYYGGYELYNYDETKFGEACLITRCEEGDKFGLDALDLEGAIVDYQTPEDMLHEKNAALKEELKKNKKAEAAEENADDADKADGEADSENPDGADDEAAEDETADEDAKDKN